MKKLLLAFVILSACTVFGQEIEEPETTTADSTQVQQQYSGPFTKIELVPSVGYILQRDSYIDANLMYGLVGCDGMFCGMAGFRLGVESNLADGNDLVVAPKIGIEVANWIIITRLSVVDYIKGSQSELRILPEVGLSFLGLINATYGYGARLTATNIDNIGSHRFEVSMNVSFEMLGALFGSRKK